MLTQSNFEKLLNDLSIHQTEAAHFDCKEDLPLDLEGDKASFIRDVAALANNETESYLVIGIQDKTWAEIGLLNGSHLLDPAQTQSRMNQILESKLDPQISIRYQIIELHEKKFGIVSIQGNHAPYIVAINDAKYGGIKTKGEPSFILRGVFYVRHGDTIVIANRQSRILEILNNLNTTNSPGKKNQHLQDFLSKNAYLDVESPEFGRNVLSQGLVERRWSEEDGKNIIVLAQSWVSILFYPIDELCKFDPNTILRKLQPGERVVRDGSWFHGLPRSISEMLFSASATPKGILGKWTGNRDLTSDQYFEAINILPD